MGNLLPNYRSFEPRAHPKDVSIQVLCKTYENKVIIDHLFIIAACYDPWKMFKHNQFAIRYMIVQIDGDFIRDKQASTDSAFLIEIPRYVHFQWVAQKCSKLSDLRIIVLNPKPAISIEVPKNNNRKIVFLTKLQIHPIGQSLGYDIVVMPVEVVGKPLRKHLFH
jgi:hypothetical protein